MTTCERCKTPLNNGYCPDCHAQRLPEQRETTTADVFRQDALSKAKRSAATGEWNLYITRWDLCQLIDLITAQQATIDEQQGTITNRLDKIQGLKP